MKLVFTENQLFLGARYGRNTNESSSRYFGSRKWALRPSTMRAIPEKYVPPLTLEHTAEEQKHVLLITRYFWTTKGKNMSYPRAHYSRWRKLRGSLSHFNEEEAILAFDFTAFAPLKCTVTPSLRPFRNSKLYAALRGILTTSSRTITY